MPNGPRAIGIIMDGNRRWARERGLSTLEGHEAGAKRVPQLVRWARAAGVREVTLYAFSTENWNRAPEEVGYLMALFERFFKDSVKELSRENVRVRFVGERSRFSPSLQESMERLEQETAGGDMTVAFALSYGGRAEILSAVNALVAGGKRDVTEEEFEAALWTRDLQDPDLVIRTGGDRRLSNFLPWQSVYSELFFTDTKWPDFSEEELALILEEFAARERRHGK